jgi:hypothetical protein
MRLPGMTTRRLMAIVAIAGTVAASAEMHRRSARYRRRADYYDTIEAITGRRYKDYVRAVVLGEVVSPEDRRFGEILRQTDTDDPRVAEYYAAMKRKYRRAARYPWLPVASDPPGPR